jgi:hypothetical protein
MSVVIALLVCTSIPVSRKKFLTMAHPYTVVRQYGEGARCTNVDPCVLVRSYSVSLL